MGYQFGVADETKSARSASDVGNYGDGRDACITSSVLNLTQIFIGRTLGPAKELQPRATREGPSGRNPRPQAQVTFWECALRSSDHINICCWVTPVSACPTSRVYSSRIFLLSSPTPVVLFSPLTLCLTRSISGLRLAWRPQGHSQSKPLATSL